MSQGKQKNNFLEVFRVEIKENYFFKLKSFEMKYLNIIYFKIYK